MNEILKIVLSLSLAGSLLILVLLLCKPLFRNRVSKRWQYYIWLVVIARLLLSFTPETSPVGTLFQQVDRVIVQTDTIPGQNIAPAPQPGDDTAIKNDTTSENGVTDAAPTPQRLFTSLIQNLWLVWLVVALILIIRKITIYQGFVKYIKAGRAEVSDTAVLDRLALIGEQAGIKRPVELYTNGLISSPLLLGFFRPCIVLPSTNLAPVDFEYTILHELTHYKRRDMFYKWLVQVSVCVHWFNPLVYLMGREVGRACELSCDEAVIWALDPQGRRAYGDTLLNAMGPGGSYKDSLASVTLNESKELLKERLDAIMRFKKSTRLTAAISVVLVFALCLGATAAGAYTNPKQQSKDNITSAERQSNNQNENIITVPVDIGTVKNGAFIWLGEFTLSYGDKMYYDVSAEKGNGLKTGFAALNDDPLNRTYFSISNKREDGTLETKGDFTFEAPVEPGQYNLFIQATDGDLMNVTGSITIENTQSPTSTAPTLSATENVKVDFDGITLTGHGPVGLELVKSQSSNVTFELLNMDNEESCTTKAEIVDGTMQITVNNYAPNGLNVNFGPDYKNVVRIYIPDAIYTRFDIQAKEMAVNMQDFNAPVHVESNRAGFRLIDTTISQGTYDIKANDGSIYIEADTFFKDITANADRGKVTVCFNKEPTNLYLDTTNCSSVIERPDDWPAIYKIGDGTPKITVLSNRGKAVIKMPISSKVVREGGIYYIFCDGADESDKPSSGVTEGSIQFVLVRKDRYTTIGPFDDITSLKDDVTEQCEYMLKAQSVTQKEINLIMEAVANIQLGNEKQYHQVSLVDDEYTKWKIDKKDGAYYYENERVRIFMDLRENNSFVNFNYDGLGTIDLRLVRGHNGDITKIERLSQTEAEEILTDLDVAHSSLMKNDGAA